MAKQESNCEGSSVVSDLINFLNVSPTAFHAVGNFTLSVFVSRSKSGFPSLIDQTAFVSVSLKFKRLNLLSALVLDYRRGKEASAKRGIRAGFRERGLEIGGW